jgi:hypothetical protein
MQDAREIAGELQVNAVSVLAGHDLDLGDHGADQIHRFAAEFGVEQQLLQVGHSPPVELGKVRVVKWGCGISDGFLGLLQRLALGFQLPHPIIHAGA